MALAFLICGLTSGVLGGTELAAAVLNKLFANLFTRSETNTAEKFNSPAKKNCFSENTGSIQVFRCFRRSRTMFVLLLKSILEKNGSTTRCLLVFCTLFLCATELNAGAYQRTRDGKTLVWNNFPTDNDVVIWSGKRDANGYATGKGTLIWYKKEKAFLTGSLLPGKGQVGGVTTYSGTMMHGKLNGPVLNVDSVGRRSQLVFADGVKTDHKTGERESTSEHRRKERPDATANVPAEGPSPAVKESAKKVATKAAKADTRKENSAPIATPPPAPDLTESPAPSTTAVASSLAATNPAQAQVSAPAPPKPQVATPSGNQPTVQVASIRATPPPVQSRPSANESDSEAKERMVADFKDETQDVLSQVGEATDDFRTADRLDAVPKLPAAVSDSVASLVQRARDFRSNVGYETAVHEFKSENETVDALSAVDQVTRSIAGKDVSAANAKLTDFLKSNPEPTADNQKPLWQFLTSMQQLCSRSEKDASVHAQRAESFAAANRTSEAIREYQEAYRIFPNPATAEKIRQLQANSLGL